MKTKVSPARIAVLAIGQLVLVTGVLVTLYFYRAERLDDLIQEKITPPFLLSVLTAGQEVPQEVDGLPLSEQASHGVDIFGHFCDMFHSQRGSFSCPFRVELSWQTNCLTILECRSQPSLKIVVDRAFQSYLRPLNRLIQDRRFEISVPNPFFSQPEPVKVPSKKNLRRKSNAK